MKEIEIFKVEGLMRDGGSINAIYTNIGIFKRVNRIHGTNNGFYNSDGSKVNGQLAVQLESALNSFFAAKQEKHKENKLKEAVETLTKALKEDEEYRRSWSANIAMNFKDEYWKIYNFDGASENEFIEIHEIANNAAENFLDLLCSAGEEE
jgi:hypothetical protein